MFSILVGLTVTGLATCGAAWPETAGHPAGLARIAGQGLSPGGRDLGLAGQGLAGQGLTPVGQGLAPAGQGLAPAGQGLAPGGQLAGIGSAKLVRYGGYAIDVPAGWPVYRINRNSSRCVRFDRHAVYLGTPGTNQQCPAHLVGRVGTVSLELHGGGGSGWTGGNWQPVAAGRGLTEGQLRVGVVLSQDVSGYRFRAVFPRGRLVVTATYGADAGLVTRLIRTVRWVGLVAGAGTGSASQGQPVGPAVSGTTAGGAATSQGGAGRPAARGAGRPTARRAGRQAVGGTAVSGPAMGQLGPARTASRGTAARRTAAGRTAARMAVADLAGLSAAGRRPDYPMKGFDTCTAPALRVMRIWRHAFKVAAIYLGGPEAACGWGNLSAAWVRSVTRMGWALLPTYVGPQAPCTQFSVRVRVRHAEAMGRAAARDAIRLARALGIRRDAPIYDDMEWYNSARSRCRRAVLAFLDGWTRALHWHDYRSGVYSSAGAAARNLGANSTVYGHRIVKPNSIWFGLWDGRANLSGTPYVLSSWWAGDHRIKQYRGAHWRRIGRARLNIDSDLVDGAVYR